MKKFLMAPAVLAAVMVTGTAFASTSGTTAPTFRGGEMTMAAGPGGMLPPVRSANADMTDPRKALAEKNTDGLRYRQLAGNGYGWTGFQGQIRQG